MRQEQVPATGNVDPRAGASEAGQQTDSQTGDTIYKFDLAAKYQDPDDPTKVIDGNTLKTRQNMGKMFSQVQSERDKMRTLLQQTQQQAQQLQQQNAQLQREMQQREQKQLTRETLREAGFKPESQDTGNGASSWFTEEAQPLSQEQVFQRIDSVVNTRVSDAVQELKGALAGIVNEGKLEEQSRRNAEEYARRVRATTEAGYKAMMPDMPDRDISNMGQLFQETMASLVIGTEASKLPDEEAQQLANESFVVASSRLDELAKLQAQGIRKQEDLDREKLVKEQTEMFGPGSKAYEELEEMKSQPEYNKEKSKKRWEDFQEKARKFERDLRRIKSQ